MKIIRLLICLNIAIGICPSATLDVITARGYFFADGGLWEIVDIGTPSYTSSLDANNLGSFGWTVQNTGSSLTGGRFLLVLDVDVDSGRNTGLNEYATLISLSLPPGSPSGSIPSTSWQVADPTSLDVQAQSGAFTNTNSVVPNGDVALGLGFDFGAVSPGGLLSAVFVLAESDVGGLKQSDPSSGYDFFLNGYLAEPDPSISTPELATFWSVGLMLLAYLSRRYARRRRTEPDGRRVSTTLRQSSQEVTEYY